ncbi:TetR/AcrR family transcriptional regulator [Rhodobacteraceae bacterium 2376]|uniref:TetR/AcrR family transcriptional regulator n=1 Tax=Rhabdonatronobacter sediminivivens TaxID=2743469 RepID=A0A7Z0HXH0_9RHOB|nr:TetR/AcrR family transcriptional regulator [Rhabdonatronobacter sediminivivens]NYS24105.1 TetR/AcrR family transcriptional regulator [Rhabdonatronobacter sediminivivens]
MPKQGYHHGNLRAALVEATLALIAEKGPQGFTMAEAAKLAGVSAAAPYRHFEGREELIAEVARQGYTLFGDLLEYAYDDGQPTPLAAFLAVGHAYLAFARKHPGHYIAMFEAGVDPGANRALAQAADRAQQVLYRAAEALSARIPADRRPPPAMFAAHIWAISHGIVELYARGKPGARSPFTAEELLESGVGIYLRGLGVLDMDC